MSIITRNIILLTITLVSIVLVNAVELNAEDAIELKLESAKDEYVLIEPVKFKVTFTNVSGTEQRIVGIEQFGMFNRYLRLEITYPNGKTYIRRTHPYDGFEHFMRSSSYRGEALKPGGSFVTYLYPNFTYGNKRERIDVDNPFTTFLVPGEHKIRVVYEIPGDYQYLYLKEVGLWSNRITVNFREPTAVEEEILRPVWYNDPAKLSKEPSKLQHLSSDRIEPLKAVIDKYPDHPMTKYAVYVLAWIYSHHQLGNTNDYEPEKALELFNRLKNDYPNFRFYEVRCGIANTYYSMGEIDKVVQVVNETIAADSSLKDVWDLMDLKLEALDISVFDWIDARHQGKDIFDEKTPVIDENENK